MSDQNVPAGAEQPHAESARAQREPAGTALSRTGRANGPKRVRTAEREEADTTQQAGTQSEKAPVEQAEKVPAVQTGNASAEQAGKAPAEQAGAAREKATAVTAQLGEKATEVGQKAGAAAAQAGQKAGEVAGRVGEKAGAVAGQVGEKAAGITGEAGEKAGFVATKVGVTVIEAVEALPEPVRQRVDQGVRQVRQHPALVAAGVAAIALLLWNLRRGR
ncbi:hypothetical protein [Lentzea sp.]|uniref:hypothetical protein n=1 Tax=Lentzea sp. TaxID=56099 RepID=UPI002ED21388